MTLHLTRRALPGLAAASALLGFPGARAQGAPPQGAPTTLNVGTGGAFTSIDPHYHNLTPNNVIAYHLFNRLVETDGKFQPQPGLATEWKPLGDTTWEFRLRPGVTWSDGSPFTADDVVFTFERIPTVVNSPASFTQSVKPVKRLEVVDPLTIRMHTHNPEPLLPIFLAQPAIVSRKHGAGAATADYNSGRAAIGTGPYVLDSVLLGDKVVFKRNERFWGPRPAWDTVNYRLIANGASRTAALQAGDVDIIDQVSTRDVALLRQNPKLDIVSPAGQRLIYLYVDCEREVTPFALDNAGKQLPRNPLKDPRVRRALSHAINREGLKTQVMDGFAFPTGQLVPEGAAGHAPDLKVDKYDVALARKLLAEAGYPQGFQLTLQGPNDRYVNDRQLVEAIAQMWSRAGVKTAVNTMPASMFFSEGARDSFSVNLTGWAPDTGEASSSLIQIVASVNPEKGRGAQPKPSHFADPAIDAVIEKSLATFDPAAREALYLEATRAAVAKTAFIPVHHQVNIWAMRKGFALAPRMQEGIRSFEVSFDPKGA